MAEWERRLQAASFRGVAFESLDTSVAVGRRTVTHEYPGRDTPYTEDLGRAARRGTISAFVLGDRYMRTRDALIDALETEGPGVLVHPTMGRMTVSVEPVSVDESIERMGGFVCQFAWVEAGDVGAVSATPDASAQTEALADGIAASAATDAAGRMATDGLPGWVRVDALADIGDQMDALNELILEQGTGIITDIMDVVDDLDDIQDTIGDLVDAPATLAGRLGGVLTAASGLSTARAITASATFSAPAETPTDANADAAQALANAEQGRAIVQRQALGIYAQAIVDEDWDSADDAEAEAARLLARIRAELAIDTAGYEMRRYLRMLLAVVQRYVSDVAATLPRLRDLDVATPTTSLELAHELYGDATRASEIVGRNLITTPHYIAPQTLRVLAS